MLRVAVPWPPSNAIAPGYDPKGSDPPRRVAWRRTTRCTALRRSGTSVAGGGPEGRDAGLEPRVDGIRITGEAGVVGC